MAAARDKKRSSLSGRRTSGATSSGRKVSNTVSHMYAKKGFGVTRRTKKGLGPL